MLFFVLGNELKRNLKNHAMTVCSEKDQFQGRNIQIAPLEISTEPPSMEQAKLLARSSHRKDMATYFTLEPDSKIQYTQLFEKTKRRFEEMSEKKCFTLQAKEKFLLKHSNLVVITGPPGIGKSTLCKCFVEEMWKSMSDEEIVFFIRLRDVDFKQETTLLDFLVSFAINITSDEDRKKLLEKMEDNNTVIYIVMDGLDEANIEPQINQPSLHSSDSIATAECFIRNLISGNILPQSKKLVTSKPYRVAQLSEDFQHKILYSIKGLSETDVIKICQNVCADDKALYNIVIGHLQSNPDLLSYCRTPVICFMIMQSLRKSAAKSSVDKLNKLDTLTNIFVFDLLERFVEKLKDKDEIQIQELSELAFMGFSHDKLFFNKLELKKAGISYENTAAFLNTTLKGEKMLYFDHYMWQEFLVSIKLTLYSSLNEFNSILAKLDSEKYEVVTKFLFGLCNHSTLKNLQNKIDFKGLNTDNYHEKCKELLKELALKKLKELSVIATTSCDNYIPSILPILSWVREMEDEDFSKQAAANLKNCTFERDDEILLNDVPAINHVLRSRVQEMTVRVVEPCFVGNNCSNYFFNELDATFNQKDNIKVSSRKEKELNI